MNEKMYTYQGKQVSQTQLARILGISTQTIRNRENSGKDPTLVKGLERGKRFVNGEWISVREACDRLGISEKTMYRRLRNGIPIEEAFLIQDYRTNKKKRIYKDGREEVD